MKGAFLILVLLLSFTAYPQEADSLNLEEHVDSYVNEGTAGEESYDEEEVNHAEISPAELEQTTKYKAKKIAVRKFDQKKWKDIVGSENFEEKPDEVKPDKSRPQTSSTPWNSEILRIISFTVIIGVVLLIILSITRNVSLDYKLKKKRVPGNFDEPIENIEDFDIHQSLESTIASGNLRLAVRLYYLSLLKKLNEGGIISWQKEKTNKDYLSEIYGRNTYFDEVRILTIAYERVWYGEHSLNRDTFQKLAENFETLNQKLKASKTP
jgi:hypothetical protein